MSRTFDLSSCKSFGFRDGDGVQGFGDGRAHVSRRVLVCRWHALVHVYGCFDK